MYMVGAIIGPFFAGPCTYDHFPESRPTLTFSPSRDHFGRRVGMFMGGLIICIGTAVIATSAHVNQFIAGRFILGFGGAFMNSAGPSYTIEIAPPQWRGKFTAFYSCESISSILMVDQSDSLR